LRAATSAVDGDAVFFACDQVDAAAKLAGKARTRIAEELGLIDENRFELCWIVDFPMFEWNEDEKRIDFSHNPFSMPQGGLEALMTQDPLTIKATQYDLVCNGYELASGGIRNHRPDAMVKAFEICGYPAEAVKRKFGGMYSAFTYGPPPHGGAALGIERIIMLLAGKNFVREVIAFPLNQQGEDLMMNGPSEVEPRQLRDLSIKIDLPPAKAKVA
jgi:aspartyl-tRNA synthetase